MHAYPHLLLICELLTLFFFLIRFDPLTMQSKDRTPWIGLNNEVNYQFVYNQQTLDHTTVVNFLESAFLDQMNFCLSINSGGYM